MPAAAVIPAPIAYIKVAAVKKLVVGFGQFAIKESTHVGLMKPVSLLAAYCSKAQPLFLSGNGVWALNRLL